MTSILGTQSIQHPNGTAAATVSADGTFSSPGHVIQFQKSVGQNLSNVEWTASATTSTLYGANRNGRTYVEARSITITPKLSTSILYCVASVGWSVMVNSATMGHGSIITRNDDGSGGSLSDTIDNTDYPWYRHDRFATGNTYYPAESIIGTFSPSSTSAQVIKLRPYVYVETAGGTVTGRYNNASLFIMEIAQ